MHEPPPDSAMPAPGEWIGPYRAEAMLGVGGMSWVFRARGPQGEEVALKLIKPDIAADDIYRQRFEREVRIGQTVLHPNVVPVLDFGEHEGSPYLVQRLVDSGSLEKELERRTTLDLHTAARVCTQVAGGLDALHAAGLVHRDVKPGNILLDDRGTAHVTDFGLARDNHGIALTRPGQALGSVDYMAPEQIQGEDMTARTDVYALACVMFACIAGRPPFAGARGMRVLYAHLLDPPGDPCAERPELPRSVAAAILRGLEKDPADRPESASAFAALLQRAEGDAAG